MTASAFYRAYKVAGETPWGLIQAGTKGRTDKQLPPIPHEPTSKTGLTHINGAISMARGAPGSAAGDFFIIIGDLRPLDANDKDPGYAVFGKVVDGMDNVLKILGAPDLADTRRRRDEGPDDRKAGAVTRRGGSAPVKGSAGPARAARRPPAVSPPPADPH